MRISIEKKQIILILIFFTTLCAIVFIMVYVSNYLKKNVCYVQKTCEMCINIGDCGWCEDIEKCKRGSIDGPSDKSCAVEDWIVSDIGKCPMTVYNFFGIQIPFRENLYKADRISIYPDNETIYNMLWSFDIKKITIVFVNSSDNGKVGVEAFEIVYKMTIAYQHIARLNNVYIDIGFDGLVVDSYDNISATPSNPVIALVPPILSNETVVMEKENVIYIKGRTMEEFDLATIKFLMVALAINL